LWVAKIKYWHKGSLAIPYAKKYNITMLAFPMNTYIRGGQYHLTSGHIILGEQKNIQRYFNEIKKHPKLKNVEISGNFIMYSFDADLTDSHMQIYFTPEILLIKPVMVKPEGYSYMEVATWRKKDLEEFIKRASKWVEIKISKIKKEEITDVFIPHLMPKITEKQKKAILLAYANGYYEYPKKTNIQKLAKLFKCSPSTFQEHLRRAEEKLLPFLLENIAQM
jgi:predicted DNA binding protein